MKKTNRLPLAGAALVAGVAVLLSQSSASTDCTAALNKSLALPGAVVTVPSSCTITNLNVTASNVTLDLAAATLAVNPATTGAVISANWVKGFTLRGGTIDGAAAAGVTYVVAANNSSDFHVENMTIQNVGTPGKGQFQSGILAYNTPGFRATGNHLTNIAGYAIATSGSTAGLISGNILEHIHKNGLNLSAGVVAFGNTISFVEDAGSDSDGAYGNGAYCTAAAGCEFVANHVDHTQYSCFRAAGADGPLVSSNKLAYCGDWAVLVEFTSGHSVVSDNKISHALGGGIDIANGADNNLDFTATVSGNQCDDLMGSSDNGYPDPRGAVCVVNDRFTNAVGNTSDGALYGFAPGGSASAADSGAGTRYAENSAFDTRLWTIGLSAPYAGAIAAGDSLATAKGSRCVVAAVVNTSALSCRMVAGRVLAGDVLSDQNQNGAALVATISGPALFYTTLAINSGSIALYDVVTQASGAAGLVTCVPIPGLYGCTAGTITIASQLNAAGLRIPFAAGALADSTSGAAATVSAVTAADISMQYGYKLNPNDTTAGDIRVERPHVVGAALGVASAFAAGTTIQ